MFNHNIGQVVTVVLNMMKKSFTETSPKKEY